jgi:hypothetical protein
LGWLAKKLVALNHIAHRKGNRIAFSLTPLCLKRSREDGTGERETCAGVGGLGSSFCF